MAFDVKRTNIEITAVDKTKVAFDSIKASLFNLTGQFGGLAGVLGVGAFVAMTKRIIDQADATNDLSKRTGIAVEQIGAWRLVTEQSGTSMEALTQALAKGSKYIVQHGDDLKKIGITAKTSEQLILQLSGVISSMDADDPRRMALQLQILGKSAGELVPLLSEGEAGLRKMLDRGRELNRLFPDMAKNADAFNANLSEIKLLSGGLFVELVGKTLPSLNTYLLQIKTVVEEGNWLDKLLFFSVGYVPGKIADKTENPVTQIQRYTENIAKLKKELAGVNTYSRAGTSIADSLKKEIAQAEQSLLGQRERLIDRKTLTTPAVRDDAALNAFLGGGKTGGKASAPKRDGTAERIREMERENALLTQGKSLEDARMIARLQGDGASKQQIDTFLRLNSVQTEFENKQKASEQAQQDFKKATEDHNQAMLDMLKIADDTVTAAQKEYEDSQRGLQVLQLGESAVIRMEAARLQEAAASAEQGLAYARLNGLSAENINFTETQILKLRQLSEARFKLADSNDSREAFEKDKKRIDDLGKAQTDAIKKTEEEAIKAAENINQSLTDALLRGFESGKGFAKNFRDTLINLFKTLILRPGIEFLVNSSGISKVLGGLFGGGSGSALAGGSQVLTGTGSNSIFGQLSGIKDLFSGGNNFITSGIEKLGVLFANGNGGFLDKIGGFLGANSGAIASGFSYLGAGLQALKGNFAGAALTAVGTYFGGPIGGAIGGFVGSLFGGKKKIPRFSSQSLGAYSDGVFSSKSGAQFYKSLGATDQLGGLSEQFSRSFGSFLSTYGLNDSITTKADLLKKRKASYGLFSANFEGGSISAGITGKAKNVQDTFNRLIEDVLGRGLASAITQSKLPAGVKKFFDSLTKKEDVAEAINTLAGLKNTLGDLPQIFNSIRDAIDTTAYKTSIADLKSRFAAIGTYTDLFYTDKEKLDTFTKQITSQFGKLDQLVPATRDGFRGLVDGLMNDFSDAGRTQFSGLVALAPAADAYYKALQAQAEQLAINTGILRDASSFSSRLDFERYQGVAQNYGATFASDYTSNVEDGRISVGADGVSRVSNTGNSNIVAAINLLRTSNEMVLTTNQATAVSNSKILDELRKWFATSLPVTIVP